MLPIWDLFKRKNIKSLFLWWERQKKASVSSTNERKGHAWVGETKEGFRFRYKRKERARVGRRDKRRLPFPVQTKGRGTPRWERQKEASVSGTRKLDQVTIPCYHATRLYFKPASHHFFSWLSPVCSRFTLANNFSPVPYPLFRSSVSDSVVQRGLIANGRRNKLNEEDKTLLKLKKKKSRCGFNLREELAINNTLLFTLGLVFQIF